MAAYVIADVQVHDPVEYQKYSDRSRSTARAIGSSA